MSELENKYVEKAIPPTREERLEATDAYHGCSCDLLECSRNCCLKGRDRDFWQGSSACQMFLSVMMSAPIENTVLIMHGPVGCGHQLHMVTNSTNAGKTARGLVPKPVNWLSTNLSTTEIVNGGEKKLREAIEYADKTFRPEFIFVLSTCAPNIIGDDVEKIISDESKVVSAQLTAIHCPGFRSKYVSSAYDAFYHALIRHIKLEPIAYKDYVPLNPADPASGFLAAGYEYKKKYTVNVMTLESMGPQDENELTRILNGLNLNVNVLPEYSNADKIRFVSESALNVSLCWMHDDYFVKYLKDKYDVPYYMGMPLGLKATRKWLVDIGEHFGLEAEAERLADYEEKLVLEAIEPFKEKLKGKRVMISGGAVRSAVEASLIHDDLGMEIVSVIGLLYDSNAEPSFEELTKDHPDVPVVISDQPYEFVNQVKTYKPDIVLCHANGLSEPAKLGAVTVPEFDVGGAYFGYNGVFQVARQLAFALENDSYVKEVSKHVKFPYKKSWYEKDPFAYLKD